MNTPTHASGELRKAQSTQPVSHALPLSLRSSRRNIRRSMQILVALLGIMLANISFLHAQAPFKEWNNAYGGTSNDNLQKVIRTSDGGYLLGGYSISGVGFEKTQASQGDFDFWVVKISSAGVKQWDRRFGGSSTELLTSLLQTTDGGYLLGGTSASGISGDKSEGSRGGNDYWVIKINSSGTKLWDKRFGGNDNDVLSSVTQTSDGGYLLGGTSSTLAVSGDKSQANQGDTDYWVVKISSTGTKQWDKRFGGFFSEELSTVIQTSDGGYLLSGSSNSDTGGDKTEAGRGAYDYWIVKISSTGTKQWDRRFGGSGFDVNYALVQTSDGGYLLGGTSFSGISGDKSQASQGGSDYWIVKISSTGTKQWDRRFGGSSNDDLRSFTRTSDGGYLLGGASISGISGDKSEGNRGLNDYWAVRINSSGSKLWDRTYGGSDEDVLTSLVQTSEGGYLLAGYSYSNTSGDRTFSSRGGADYWVMKLSREPGSSDIVMSNTPRTTCSGTFYDPGFTGPYNNSQTFVQTFTPATSGSKLRFTFTSFQLEASFDFLYIYDGASTGAPLIGTFTGTNSPGTVTATNAAGQLTFRFVSDASITFSGWTATISCTTPPPPPVTKIWDRRFGGSSTDNFTRMVRTTDGGYLLGGHSTSGISGDKTEAGRGAFDFWVVKINSSGTKVWDKRFGGTADEALNAIVATSDGGFLLGGTSASGIGGDKTEASRGDRDFWVVRLNSSGGKVWDKRFGGTAFEDLRDAIQTSDGGFLLVGHSASGIGGDKTEASRGARDYWAVKISSTGAKQWDKRFGGSLDDNVEAVVATSDGGYLLGGSSASGSGGDKTELSRGGFDYWVVKINSTGGKVWDKRFGGTADDLQNTMVTTTDGGYLLAGTSGSGTGGDKTEASRGGTDYWAVKINSTGGKVWDKRFGGSGADDGRSVTRTTDGGFMLGGFSSSGLDGDKTETSQGLSDYWVVKLNSSGGKQWDKRYGGNNTEELRTVLQASDGGYVLGGRSASGISGDRSQSSQGGVDYWIVKTSAATVNTLVAEAPARIADEALTTTEEALFTAQPNPFSDRVTLRFQLPQTQRASLAVFDAQGKTVATLFEDEAEAGREYAFEVSAGSMNAGIYFARLVTPQKVHHQKLMLVR